MKRRLKSLIAFVCAITMLLGSNVSSFAYGGSNGGYKPHVHNWHWVKDVETSPGVWQGWYNCTGQGGCNGFKWGDPKDDHSCKHPTSTMVKENEVPATCVDKGSYDEVYYCDTCKTEVSRETKYTDPFGHDWGDWFVDKVASCKEAGIEKRVCERCKDFDTRPIDKLQHETATKLENLVNCKVDKNGNVVSTTCAADGSYDFVTYCKNCNEEIDRVPNKVDKKAHKEAITFCDFSYCSLDYYSGKVNPTSCKHEGTYYKVTFCTVCNAEIDREPVNVGKKAHKEAVKYENFKNCEKDRFGNIVPTSCKNEGTYDKVTYCTVCNEEIDREPINVGKKAHDPYTYYDNFKNCYRDLYTGKFISTTCKEDGSYDKVTMCTVCKEEISRTPMTVKAKAHTPATKIDNVKYCEKDRYGKYVPTSCEFEGTYDKVTYCTCCDKELDRETIKVGTKKHVEAVKYENFKNCEKDRFGNIVPTSCKNEGTYDKVTYCKNCNKEIDRETIKVGTKAHSPYTYYENFENCYRDLYTGKIISTSCKDDGSYDKVTFCTVCKKELSRETIPVAKKAHTPYTVNENLKNCTYDIFGNIVPTKCDEDGTYDKVTYCSCCHQELKSEPQNVGKACHVPGFPVVENKEGIKLENGKFVTTSCTEDGSYDLVTYCICCKKELSRDNKIVKAPGHDEYTVIENEKGVEKNDAGEYIATSCTEDGSYDIVTYCKRCEKELDRDTITVPALGHDEYTVVENEKGVKKDENGNYVTTECDVDGSYDIVTYCKRCEKELDRDTIIVPAPGHEIAYKVENEKGVKLVSNIDKGGLMLNALGSKPIPPKPSFNYVTTSCTVDGSYDLVTYCTTCGKELDRETITVKAPGHNMGEWEVVKPAKCVEDGLARRHCLNDGCDYFEDKVLPAIGHDFGGDDDYVIENRVEPTTTHDGGYDKVWHCKHEGCTATKVEHVVIPQLTPDVPVEPEPDPLPGLPQTGGPENSLLIPIGFAALLMIAGGSVVVIYSQKRKREEEAEG